MNFRKAIILLCFAAPICALFNTLVMFFTIEHSSGFFRTGYGSLAALMLGATALLVFLSSFSFSKIKRQTAPSYWVYVHSLCSFALGVCLIAEAFKSNPLVGTSEALFSAIRIFGILSGVVFLVLTTENMLSVKAPQLIYVIPVIYYILKIISAFISYAAVATIPETALELFSICATLIFALSFAKMKNGIKNKKGKSISLPVSIICALVILTQIAPYAANYFLKEDVLLHANSLFTPTSCAMALFIVSASLFVNKEELVKE